MANKAPGLFESIRRLIYSSVRVVDDGAETARLMLAPIQAESLKEAHETLEELGMTLEQFKEAKQRLLA